MFIISIQAYKTWCFKPKTKILAYLKNLSKGEYAFRILFSFLFSDAPYYIRSHRPYLLSVA